jgi:hypothetical protein
MTQSLMSDPQGHPIPANRTPRCRLPVAMRLHECLWFEKDWQVMQEFPPAHCEGILRVGCIADFPQSALHKYRHPSADSEMESRRDDPRQAALKPSCFFARALFRRLDPREIDVVQASCCALLILRLPDTARRPY